MKTTVILVRHGETSWNKEKRVQGQTDIPLSETGIEQAKALQKKLKTLGITTIYTSTLQRAIHTAEIATEGLEIAISRHEGLNERTFGEHDGKTLEEIVKLFGTEETFFALTPKTGESFDTFQKRVLGTFDTILAKHLGETILIVSHGGVLRVLIRHLKQMTEDQKLDIPIHNTSLSIFHVDDEAIIEELVGDISHLE